VRAALAAGLQRLMWNDPGVRLGEVEPVHQMRVACRRLRSDLRTFKPLVEPEWAQPLLVDLRWLARLLGAVRDADVLGAHLRTTSGELEGDLVGLFEDLARERASEHTVLLDAMRGRRYREALERLVQAARDPRVTPAARQPCGEALPPLVRKAWRKARRWVDALDDDASEEELHRARILTKRARYAAEAVAPALGGRAEEATRFARRAADVQDVLGLLQDAAMARAAIERIALRRSADGGLSFAAGRLLERQLRLAHDVRAGFGATWGKLDRAKQRGWMRA
jgi:CHAD domain-containing protein